MKKIIGLVILCTILFAFGLQAYAVDSSNIDIEVTPQWVNLKSVSSYLEIDNLGIATCIGRVSHSSVGGTCKLIMNLQKFSNNQWNTIYTWTTVGDSYSYNEAYRAVTKGTYRLVVTGIVYDSNGNFIESGSATSINKKY